MKNIYLIHGWSGNPKNCWFPWMKSKLEENGFNVKSLSMPTPNEPNPETWPAELEHQIGEPNADTYLVGHSIGCQAIMRYLASQPDQVKVGGVLFVAPFYALPNLQTQEEKDIWQKWENKPFDFENFKAKTDNRVAIFSDDDPDVDYRTNEPFFKALGFKTILEQGKGHFSDGDHVTELPSALEQILAMAK